MLTDAIVIFDPAIIESERIDLSTFLQSFVHKEGLFRFRINPNRVSVSKSKLTAEQLTSGGYERSYFGNGFTTLNYSGTTGRFWLPQDLLRQHVQDKYLSPFQDTKLSPVFQKFLQFIQFYEKLDNDVMLQDHRGNLYRGAIKSFNYTDVSEKPYEIEYDFSFEAYTDEMFADRLGNAIKRLGKYENLDKNYLASLAFSGFTKAMGAVTPRSCISGREGITTAIGSL